MIIPMLCVTIFVILVVWFLLPRVARLMIHTPTAISIFVSLSMVQLMAVLDRKSGSAGMPRPISYAVFCLKKKMLHRQLLQRRRVIGEAGLGALLRRQSQLDAQDLSQLWCIATVDLG